MRLHDWAFGAELRRSRLRRRGGFQVLALMTLTASLGVVAMSVDLAVVSLTKTQMQNAVDAAALAASQEITSAVASAGESGSGAGDVSSIAVGAARAMAQKVAALNGVYVDPDRDVRFGKRVYRDGGFTILWDVAPYNVVQVTARRDNDEPGQPDSKLDLFFAGVTGEKDATLVASAIAFVEARDIVMVLDYSGSMNDDSTFAGFSKLGQINVEANMQDIWSALGPPALGSLGFTPQWLVVKKGAGSSETTVTFRNTAVDVSSLSNYSKVVLTFSDNGTQTFSGLSASSGTYAGSGSKAAKSINRVVVTVPASSIKVKGATPTSGSLPQIYVTFSGTAVFVESSKDLSNVVLEFSDGVKYKFDGLTGQTGTFAGIGSNSGKWIARAWIKSGSNSSGDGPGYGERFNNPQGSSSSTSTTELTFDDTVDVVVETFGLAGIPYPYHSGSWSDWVSFNRSDSSTNTAGYRRKYGGLTFVQYVLTQKNQHNQTQDLWKAPHYPFHAMKEGTTLFTEFLAGLEFGDHLGLVTYDERARIETVLNEADIPETVDLGSDWITSDYAAIDTIQRHKQAGHYAQYTNIADGLNQAKVLLDAKMRAGARPTVILMTDGQANRRVSGVSLPAGWSWSDLTDYDGDGQADYSTTDQNKLCAFIMAKRLIDAGVTIHTLTVGADADRDLMRAIAFAGGGEWIDCPGGSTIAAMEGQLLSAFGRIAANVPPPKLLHDPDAN